MFAEVPTMVKTSEAALRDSFTQAYNQIYAWAPRVVIMVVVVVVGYIASRFVARLFTALCEKIGLQVAAERSGLAASMQHIGIKRNVPAIVGTIVFWLLMCVFGMAAFHILGLERLESAMGKLVDYIPNLLVATVVVVGRPADRHASSAAWWPPARTAWASLTPSTWPTAATTSSPC